MNGWELHSLKQGELFKSVIVFNNSKVIIEIGVATATTTKYLCEAANITGGFVYGYDLWGTHGLHNQFPAFSTKEQCEAYLNSFSYKNFELTQINTKTAEFVDLVNKKHPSIDFVFIDACHSYWGIKNDFDAVYPLLSENGIIAFHDTLRIDGCREFLIDLRTKYYDGTYDIIDFPWGNDDRRVGISFLVKRTYPIININIDERCGSISTPEEIYKKEQDWYNNEINKNKNG